MKRMKKVLSLFLAIAMIVALMPTMAFAADPTTQFQIEVTATGSADGGRLVAGDTVTVKLKSPTVAIEGFNVITAGITFDNKKFTLESRSSTGVREAFNAAFGATGGDSEGDVDETADVYYQTFTTLSAANDSGDVSIATTNKKASGYTLPADTVVLEAVFTVKDGWSGKASFGGYLTSLYKYVSSGEAANNTEVTNDYSVGDAATVDCYVYSNISVTDDYTGKVYNKTAVDDPTSAQIATDNTDGVLSFEYYLADGTTLTTAENSGAASEGAAPVKAGEYSVKATVGDNGYYLAKTGDAKAFTIEPKTLTVTGLTVNDKEYDGTTSAQVSGSIALVGIESGDSVSLEVAKAPYFEDKNAADEAKNVVLQYGLTGDDAGNYTLEQPSAAAKITRAKYTYTGPEKTATATVGEAMPTSESATAEGVDVNGSKEPVSGTLSWYTDEGRTQAASGTFDSAAATPTLYWRFTPSASETNYVTTSVEGETTYTIEKGTASVTKAPTAKELTYSGEQQSLVNAGTASGGSMVYSLDKDGVFNAVIPTGLAADTYIVYYKAKGDDNHEDSAIGSVEVTISKANSSVTTDPIAKSDITYTGKAQELISAGTAEGGELQYRVGTEGEYSAEIPSAANTGTYYIYYKVVGDSNHKDYEAENPIEVTIAKANSEITTAPAAKSDLAYTGEAQDLITAGAATGGELQYSTDGVNYITTAPQGTDAGDYTVYYKVVGNDNYNGLDGGSFDVTIAKGQQEALSISNTETKIVVGNTITLTTTGGSGNGNVIYDIISDTTLATLSDDQLTADKVGEVTVKAVKAGGDNYEDISAEKTFRIVAGATVSGTATGWGANSEVTYKLYPVAEGVDLTEEAIKADLAGTTPITGAIEVSSTGELTDADNNKIYDQTFSFELVQSGTYKLVTAGPEGYVMTITEAFTVALDDIYLGKIENWLLGDVDLSGKVDINDANMMLQHIVHNITLEGLPLKLFDVNGVGGAEIGDPNQVLQYIVKNRATVY